MRCAAAARSLASAAALTCAVAIAGCGLGAGPTSQGTVTLTVTRDYGSKALVEATDSDPPSSETVIRLLDSNADITTRYGGGFVQAIDGLSGSESGGRAYDWFFYVNGIESPVGSADVGVKGGDRIWWDYRDWTSAISVPAVVGSWPEPFAQASVGDPQPVRVDCLGGGDACAVAARRLGGAGVETVVHGRGEPTRLGGDGLRLVVGPWADVRQDSAVDALRGSPTATGVFATYKGPRPDGSFHLIALDPGAKPVADLGSGAGLVAALGDGGDGATWIATGSTDAAVRRAVGLLDAADLRSHYAVAADGRKVVPLPIVSSGKGSA
jgi:Domain of unknown function (DUF4430)